MAEHCNAQVSALQRGFSGLADAVLEELDALHAREAVWQRERASMAGLAAEVRRKLSGAISPAEAADLRDRCAQLEVRLAAATATAESARAEARHATAAAAEARRGHDAHALRLDALQAQAAQADGLLASEVAAARADVAALHTWALEVERSQGARLAQLEAGLRAAAAAREVDASAAAAATATAVEQMGSRLASHARRTEVRSCHAYRLRAC